MRDEEIVDLVESSHAFTLALVEVLMRKPVRFGFLVTRRDLKTMAKKQKKILEDMKKERRRSATGLILPPGVKS